jgi:hypothetical protein
MTTDQNRDLSAPVASAPRRQVNWGPAMFMGGGEEKDGDVISSGLQSGGTRVTGNRSGSPAR